MNKYYITTPDGTQKGPILEANLVTTTQWLLLAVGAGAVAVYVLWPVAAVAIAAWLYGVRPFVSLTVRRLHDAGLSGKWAWLLLLHPFNGFYVYLTLLLLSMYGAGGSWGLVILPLLMLGSLVFFIALVFCPAKSKNEPGELPDIMEN